MNKAVITIDYRYYLVDDPKKALAVIATLNAAKRVEATGYNDFTISQEPVDASMQTLSAKVIIKQPKSSTKKPTANAKDQPTEPAI
jgi:hypothetical protein